MTKLFRVERCSYCTAEHWLILKHGTMKAVDAYDSKPQAETAAARLNRAASRREATKSKGTR